MSTPGNVWTLRDGREIYLLRPEQLAALPVGTELVTISGRSLVWGTDPVDTDTRGGWLSCGPLYVPGVTEREVGTEHMVGLDPSREYRVRVTAASSAERGMSALRERGWQPTSGSGGRTLEKSGTPAAISRDFSDLSVALRLGHSLLANIKTTEGWLTCSLYADGIGASRIVRGEPGQQLS